MSDQQLQNNGSPLGGIIGAWQAAQGVKQGQADQQAQADAADAAAKQQEFQNNMQTQSFGLQQQGQANSQANADRNYQLDKTAQDNAKAEADRKAKDAFDYHSALMKQNSEKNMLKLTQDDWKQIHASEDKYMLQGGLTADQARDLAMFNHSLNLLPLPGYKDPGFRGQIGDAPVVAGTPPQAAQEGQPGVAGAAQSILPNPTDIPQLPSVPQSAMPGQQAQPQQPAQGQGAPVQPIPPTPTEIGKIRMPGVVATIENKQAQTEKTKMQTAYIPWAMAMKREGLTSVEDYRKFGQEDRQRHELVMEGFEKAKIDANTAYQAASTALKQAQIKVQQAGGKGDALHDRTVIAAYDALGAEKQRMADQRDKQDKLLASTLQEIDLTKGQLNMKAPDARTNPKAFREYQLMQATGNDRLKTLEVDRKIYSNNYNEAQGHLNFLRDKMAERQQMLDDVGKPKGAAPNAMNITEQQEIQEKMLRRAGAPPQGKLMRGADKGATPLAPVSRPTNKRPAPVTPPATKKPVVVSGPGFTMTQK